MIAYFTRNDPAVTAAVWQEQLHGAIKVNPSAPQFFCLKDCKAAAFVLEYPRDNPSMWTSLLRLISTVPLGKWRALLEWLNSKDKQKAAFSRAHGSFMYLMAMSDDSKRQDGEACVAILEAICTAADANQQMVYIEARPKQRAWLTAHGFSDVMGYRVRDSKKAPQINIMCRTPNPLPPPLPRRR